MKKRISRRKNLHPVNDPNRLLTAVDASKLFSVPLTIMEEALQNGEVPHLIKHGEKVARWQDIERYVDKLMREVLCLDDNNPVDDDDF